VQLFCVLIDALQRFFFVYTGRGDEGGANCSTESEAFNQEILNAMKREKSSKYK
jgi:hypothetical protein